MCLYFDAIFHLVWLVLTIYHLVNRQPLLEEIWYITFIAASALQVFLNPARIYLGYMGNIIESTPYVFCFLLLCVFPTLVLNAYLFFTSFLGTARLCPQATTTPHWECIPPSNTVGNGIQVPTNSTCILNIHYCFSSHSSWLNAFSDSAWESGSPNTKKTPRTSTSSSTLHHSTPSFLTRKRHFDNLKTFLFFYSLF